MKYSFGKNIVVVALGGSIMYPDKIDVSFLKQFKKFIQKYLKNKKFIIIAGGGKISRTYQEAASKITRVTDNDKDWIGIHATRTNAHLLRTIFRDYADPVVIDTRGRTKKLEYPITIASGWRPGWSTDYISVALAVDFRVPEVIIAGKPAYVYDKDPHSVDGRRRNAKPLKNLSWKHYRKMIPAKWMPGAHVPVDPVAAKLAQKNRITAIVVNGKDLRNLGNFLDHKEFSGTIIK